MKGVLLWLGVACGVTMTLSQAPGMRLKMSGLYTSRNARISEEDDYQPPPAKRIAREEEVNRIIDNVVYQGLNGWQSGLQRDRKGNPWFIRSLDDYGANTDDNWNRIHARFLLNKHNQGEPYTSNQFSSSKHHSSPPMTDRWKEFIHDDTLPLIIVDDPPRVKPSDSGEQDRLHQRVKLREYGESLLSATKVNHHRKNIQPPRIPVQSDRRLFDEKMTNVDPLSRVPIDFEKRTMQRVSSMMKGLKRRWSDMSNQQLFHE